MNRTRTLLIAAGAFGLGILSGRLPAVRAQAPAAAEIHVTVIHRNKMSDHTKDGTAVPGEVLGFSCTTPFGDMPSDCYVLSR